MMMVAGLNALEIETNVLMHGERERARVCGWYKETNEFRDRTRGRSCLGLIEQRRRKRTSFSVGRIRVWEREREGKGERDGEERHNEGKQV